MRILFDHGTPSGIAGSLSGHEVTEAIERGWDRMSNGELLKAAEAAGFDLLLTTDKRIRYAAKFDRPGNSHCCSRELHLAGCDAVSRPHCLGRERHHSRQLHLCVPSGEATFDADLRNADRATFYQALTG